MPLIIDGRANAKIIDDRVRAYAIELFLPLNKISCMILPRMKVTPGHQIRMCPSFVFAEWLRFVARFTVPMMRLAMPSGHTLSTIAITTIICQPSRIPSLLLDVAFIMAPSMTAMIRSTKGQTINTMLREREFLCGVNCVGCCGFIRSLPIQYSWRRRLLQDGHCGLYLCHLCRRLALG